MDNTYMDDIKVPGICVRCEDETKINNFDQQLLDTTILEEIKSIRTKNNSPWIELFRIALQKDRDRALICAKQILENDAAINNLLRLIVEGDEK
jgi:hypothetical protein